LKIPFLRGRAKPPSVEELRFRAEPLVAALRGEVLDRYSVDQAAVFIADSDGRGLYLVSEPELTAEEQRIYSLLMESLYYSMKPAVRVEDPMKYVEGFIWESAEDLGIVDAVQKSFQKLKYYISRDAFGYGPLHVTMLDPDVEEISVTSYATPVNVIHRRFTQYDWLETNITFGSEDALRNYVQRLAQRAGKSVTIAIPFCDAMTREGHRIAVTFADEVTLPGSTLSIRKFPESPLSMAHLLRFRTLTPLMASYLWLVAEYKGFVMTVGAMGSGKTTMLNCILTMIDPTLKIATIEDVPELRIPHPSWQRFKARHTYSITEAKFDIDLMDLVKLSLRYRPDYIVVGEVRGEEIRALVQAAALGHGCLCLAEDEAIPFMNSGTFRLTTIGDLVDGILEGRYKSVSVFSLDVDDWRIVPSKVKRVFKVPSSGFLLRIRAEGGKELKVSPDHPLLVMEPSGLKVKRAEHARPGDALPFTKRMPASEDGLGSEDICFARIIRVSREPYDGFFYDVETEKGTFLHSTCAVTHNCSFHGESPEAAIIRMKSPPMDVPEGNLMLIWCFTLLGRVKMPDGDMVRRVLEITEVVPRDGRIELTRLFTWDARRDAFTPDDAEAVVKRSYRLGSVKRLTGWGDSELAEELRRRSAYLEKVVEEGKLNYPDFAEAVRRFYVGRKGRTE